MDSMQSVSIFSSRQDLIKADRMGCTAWPTDVDRNCVMCQHRYQRSCELALRRFMLNTGITSWLNLRSLRLEVATSSLELLRPIFLMEMFTIKTKLLRIDDETNSLFLEQRIEAG